MTAFLPATTRWFHDALGAPSKAQELGWARIRAGQHTLIAAPTGSGKTLAAFLNALDGLFRQGQALPAATQVVYVSPLRALSHDIQKNLQVPLAGIRALDAALPEVRALVRTGDTKASERTAMGRKPPHVLVTTPESLYVLLTSTSGRKMLATTRTVIVDEIHALVRDKRGSHLALSLERLEALVASAGHGPLQRIGLSATQRPIEDTARFLVGPGRQCEIVDTGHLRTLDLDVLLPRSPLSAVCSNELWGEIYDQIVAAVEPERTTLVFTNTRKLAERVAARLSERLGKERVTSHHGSLSKAHRLQAEQRLKQGQLKALVTTSSLELGIDIGDVDLVVQIGVPGAIATFLQRVGRAGHGPGRVPKGRIVPLTTDDLVVATALLRCVRAGELDRVVPPEAPLDILSQQVVAELVAAPRREDELFELARRAWPYRALVREDFDQVLALHSEGRLALLHRNRQDGTVRATKRARIPALTAGGAIPEVASYEVVLEPEGARIGTVEEDFAVESSVGDVFQLGNHSWRIVRAERGTLRVIDAGDVPPSLPFWLGEGLSRSRELAAAVAQLRVDATAQEFVGAEPVSHEAGAQIHMHCLAGALHLGTVPTQRQLVLERFLDEAGGSQLVLHAPLGSRINKALGLALRKRFCRGFGFELQAAANEDAVLLSLGPTHEFALADVWTYLHPNTARDVLVQAVLQAPMFKTRWRWNLQRSLLLPRTQGGKRMPPNIARIRAEDMLTAAFPAVQACAETLPGGDLQVPWEHPIVRQTLHDCLHEAMDVDGMLAVLAGIRGGTIATREVESTEPSTFANGILNALPYMFLDDEGEIQNRRTQAVAQGKAPGALAADGTEVVELDAAAVEAVRDELRLQPADAEELHEALLWCGWIEGDEVPPLEALLDGLLAAGRVRREGARVVAADAPADPKQRWRGRLEWSGPVFSAAPELDEMVREGIAQRVRVAGREGVCNRRLVLRILRRARDARRVAFAPASTAEYLRFLAQWQHVHPERRLVGPAGVLEVVRQLAGCEVPAAEWERSVLPARVLDYRREWLDQLAFQGEVAWCRLTGSSRPSLRKTPVALVPRDELATWLALAPATEGGGLSAGAQQVLGALKQKGPQFLRELRAATGLLQSWLEDAVQELVARGLVTCDSFLALRQMLVPVARRRAPLDPPGRFSLVRGEPQEQPDEDRLAEALARTCVRRYGVVVRRALLKEPAWLPWRVVLRALRLLELRGEVVCGRFVAGWDGEQFALPAAVELLRQSLKSTAKVAITVAAADPLNLEGLLTAGPRVSRQRRVRIGLPD